MTMQEETSITVTGTSMPSSANICVIPIFFPIRPFTTCSFYLRSDSLTRTENSQLHRYLAFPEGHAMYQTTLQKQAFVQERISTEFAEQLTPTRLFIHRSLPATPPR